MTDSLTKRIQPESHVLGVSPEKLQKAVDKVGNSAAAVRKELGLQSTQL
jgi:hypothetical protein